MMIKRGLCVAAGVLLLSSLASGQYETPTASPSKKQTKEQRMTTIEHRTMTTEQKIRNAVAAAPVSISSKATIKDWPATEGAQPVVLREGSNGWTCFPDMPHTKGNDPMCLDQPWIAWLDGYINHKNPEITRLGIGYMIAPGGGWASNTDPYASKETPDNQWGYDPPHIMIVLPSVDVVLDVDERPTTTTVVHALLNSLPTNRAGGGPWIMYAGTPYAHIMVPVSGPPTGPRATR